MVNDLKVAKSIRWRRESAYVVSPARVFVKNIGQEAQAIRREVIIRRSDGNRFSLNRVETPAEYIHCSFKKALKSAQHKLVLEIEPKQLQRPFWTIIRVTTDDDLQPELTVSVAGFP